MTVAGINELHDILLQLDEKHGELAEVKKAELDAERDGFIGANVTEARHNAKMFAINHTKDAIDLQADISSLERWAAYWTLRINKDI